METPVVSPPQIPSIRNFIHEPIMRLSLLSLAAACVALVSADATAQRIGPSVEAGVGVSSGGGGEYIHRGGAALDGVIATPLVQTGSGAVLLAFTGTVNGPIAMEDVCVVAPDDACYAEYPTFVSLGVAAGVQRRLGSSASARVLAGPAYYQAVDGGDAFGLQGRVDVAKPILSRLVVVASLRGTVLPRYQGETLRFGAFGLGLRIQ
ncbi:hypothetical protein [Longimicrobium sp.]|uniref:hypothetical protein n=1 Tax=Longimicrobium sp. TaxID=2029185 RepID=UPI002E377469|nr:hypothetical protein [Longimicrobium sp.]HEX6038122.1 hypothetical protein [Longimicrobium sp.]